MVSFEKISAASQANSATSHRRFEFQKRGQLFIRTRNEAFTVAVPRLRSTAFDPENQWLTHNPSSNRVSLDCPR